MDAPGKRAQRYSLFVTYVEDNKDVGIDGNNQKRPYISREKLSDYWNGNTMLDLLGANDRQVTVHAISTTHLQIFSILVWISNYHHNWIDYIPHFIFAKFTDTQLPLAPPPKQGEPSPYDQRSCPFPDNPEGRKAWLRFSEEQWRFVPLQFRPPDGTYIERVHLGRDDVDVRQIRPITVLDQLHPRSFSPAKIYKVQPHESSGLPVNHPIILKEYPVDELTDQFEQEHTVYTAISNNMHDSPDHRDTHFLRYYGAFLQGDTVVLLLEYCSQGTLLDLFQDGWYLPRTQEEAHALWAAALHLLEGLDFLHSKGGNSLVLHQDIKPANIFVFKETQPGKPDKLFFKLGDFGMSSTTYPSVEGEAEGPDNQGSRMYSAPEIAAWAESDQHIIRRMTKWASDIWSFGCVLYELALWMAKFERGRIEFREARIEATKHIPRIVDAGPNPIGRLQARQLKLHLMDWLNEITAPVSEPASIPTTLQDSPQLVESPPPLIRSPTTPNSRHRLPSTPLRTSAFELPGSPYIFSNQSHMTSPVSEHITDFRFLQYESPSGSGAQGHSPHGSHTSYPTIPSVSGSNVPQNKIANLEINGNTPVAAPKYRDSYYTPCTVDEIIKQGWPQKSKNERDENKLPGMSKVDRDLKDRDQCFIIDNSLSMTDYWEKVKRTTLALVSVVQDIDPGDIELFCTNRANSTNTDNHMKTKGCKGLEEWLDENQPHSNIGPCQMENQLNDILPELVTKAAKRKISDHFRKKQRTKGINVYVLTNGVWEHRDSETVEAVTQSMKTIVSRVKKHSLHHTFLSIQFVRFGEHLIGTKRLQWLDDELKYHIPDGWDIVDTTHHTGNVRKMLIGATSAWEDRIEEEI
ncbi:kinase-like domain-containing protein [Xylaria arbuscula]|nr:kinase-like domain-containing protein [Xylaria arbuscula]